MVAPVREGCAREGYDLFARFAYPPNELGYCGPPGVSVEELGQRAREFDGAWPYLSALGAACGRDPLDAEVVRSYWVGGSLLDSLAPAALLARLRGDFSGQTTGLLGSVDSAVAHHSFHVFVVYPWVRFLGRKDPATPLRVLQSCRIRWGTVQSVSSEYAEVRSRPLVYDGTLGFGDPVVEAVRWRKGTSELVRAPAAGDVVASHWDWICGRLDDADVAALEERTGQVLDLVRGCL